MHYQNKFVQWIAFLLLSLDSRLICLEWHMVFNCLRPSLSFIFYLVFILIVLFDCLYSSDFNDNYRVCTYFGYFLYLVKRLEHLCIGPIEIVYIISSTHRDCSFHHGISSDADCVATNSYECVITTFLCLAYVAVNVL